MNKIIKELKDNLMQLKLNFIKYDVKSQDIEKNIFDLTVLTNKLETNISHNLSRSSSEYSMDSLENIPEINFVEYKKMLNDWNINFFNIRDKNELIKIVYFMFIDIFDFENLKFNEKSFYNCVLEIYARYNNNPYHNFQHALTVTHFLYLIIINIDLHEKISKYKLFSLLFSGLVHDIDHPGTDNIFEANKKSFLALQYNDKSILENHHCSTAFYIMQLNHIKLLQFLNNEEFNEVRTTIIECVLATDMKNHFSIIETKNILENEISICKLLIHGADLCNQLKCFKVYKDGLLRIYQEFTIQAIKEKKLQLPITKKIDIENNQELLNSEISFSTFFVKPLWTIITKIFPSLTFLLFELENNMEELTLLLSDENYSISESESDM